MREIKFRGMDKNGDWHYGDLLHHDHGILIIVDEQGKQHKIINKTLGQFIGLQDESGIDIYEGDFCQAGTQFMTISNEDPIWLTIIALIKGNPGMYQKLKIIGNIHLNAARILRPL